MSAKEKTLDAEFSAKFDSIRKEDFSELLSRFSDANIFQTWSYDAVRCGEKNISHMVLRKSNRVCAVAQARIVRIPIIGKGAAYLRWAPVWQHKNQPPDTDVLRAALRALRNEYVCRRGLILRIFPILFNDPSTPYHAILAQEGYTRVPDENPGRTLIMDISQPLDTVRKKLNQKWRNCLNRSEKNQLEVVEGTGDELFADFITIYQALLERKQFQEPNDINEFRAIQKDLPDAYKMRIFLCRSNGMTSAGLICATVGETGVYLFGATNREGMSNKGSYLLQWGAIQWMKQNGCCYYNLNGINPEKNPGSYHFKKGLLGKNGRDVYYIGRYDCYSNKTIARLAQYADSFMPGIKYFLSKKKTQK